MTNRFTIALVIAGLLCCGSAVGHGWLDGRWLAQPDLIKQGDLLSQLPAVVGDWELLEDRELTENVQNILRCYGYKHSVYQNRVTGETLTMAVLYGPRGPIAVHTPEICYSGQGVQADGDRRKVALEIDGEVHEFWSVSFLSKIDMQPELEVFYAWSNGGNWLAAEQPRFWLTDELYKIQLAAPPAIPANPQLGRNFSSNSFPSCSRC